MNKKNKKKSSSNFRPILLTCLISLLCLVVGTYFLFNYFAYKDFQDLRTVNTKPVETQVVIEPVINVDIQGSFVPTDLLIQNNEFLLLGNMYPKNKLHAENINLSWSILTLQVNKLASTAIASSERVLPVVKSTLTAVAERNNLYYFGYQFTSNPAGGQAVYAKNGDVSSSNLPHQSNLGWKNLPQKITYYEPADNSYIHYFSTSKHLYTVVFQDKAMNDVYKAQILSDGDISDWQKAGEVTTSWPHAFTERSVYAFQDNWGLSSMSLIYPIEEDGTIGQPTAVPTHLPVHPNDFSRGKFVRTETDTYYIAPAIKDHFTEVTAYKAKNSLNEMKFVEIKKLTYPLSFQPNIVKESGSTVYMVSYTFNYNPDKSNKANTGDTQVQFAYFDLD